MTDASAHDGPQFDGLLNQANTSADVYADSAYRSAEAEAKLRLRGLRSRIHQRANRNHPLSQAQENANRQKSRVRARIEHVFGAQQTSPGGRIVRTNGRLIAHPDISLVLRNTDMTRLAQVAAARSGQAELVQEGDDLHGGKVLSAYAPVSPLGWQVFVELPVEEAYASLYNSIKRSGLIMLGGLMLAFLAGLLLARRMVIPIQMLRAGAQRIGGGDLGQRISIKTGDELEGLADQFNDMANRLGESYSSLERKVELRTRELAQSVEELRALGEVSQAVNSTLDLQTVLDTIVAKAVQLSSTDAGTIFVFNEAHGRIRGPCQLRDERGRSRSARTTPCRAVYMAQTCDQAAPAGPGCGPEPSIGVAPVAVAPTTCPGNRLLGADIHPAARRRSHRRCPRRAPESAGEFPKSTIDLLQTFAAQSVLAIQNSRLFNEIQVKGHELEVASQHKSQFLANMSHELRTPLNAILGYTELVLDNIYGEVPERARTVLERVQSNGKHLLGLINDVLDLSKIEAGQLNLSLEDYSIRDVVHSVFSVVEPLAVDKRLALKIDLPSDLPVAHGDERRLTQVLLNLVGNAIKFTDTGEVVIKAAAANGHYTLAVRDTGPGITPSDQVKIFEEFQQADNSSTKTKGGTGLGLSIAKRIVNLHGGRIWVSSELGSGSTFFIEVPIKVEQQAGHA